MSSDAELNAKLTELLRVMVSRLPPNKKLPTAVVQQLLRTKYGDTYPEAYVSGHESFIAGMIRKLSDEKEKATAAADVDDHAKRVRPSSSSSSSSSEAEDESDADDDDDESEEESDDSEEDEEEESEEDEEDELNSGSDDDDDTENSEEEGDGEGPDRKRARAEELDAIAKKEGQQQQQHKESGGEASAGTTTVSLGERCKAMVECLRKLSYRVRGPSDAESLEEYLQNFLIAEFKKHNMDPEKYGKSDIKRYRIKREVELLQQDGASLSLDRRNRVGRGFSNIVVPANGAAPAAAAPVPPTVAKQTSMFLDDE